MSKGKNRKLKKISSISHFVLIDDEARQSGVNHTNNELHHAVKLTCHTAFSASSFVFMDKTFGRRMID